MTRDEFEADLLKQGYGVFYGGFRAGLENPEHTHPWDARLFILGGEITITVHGGGSLFKGNEIKRAVQTGQVQIGDLTASNANVSIETPGLVIDADPATSATVDEETEVP